MTIATGPSGGRRLVSVTMKELLEAGVHFGHQTRRWNPKMKQYIFGARNGIYIIDLQKTSRLLREALDVRLATSAPRGGSVLFVGTKRQAQEPVVEESARCGMHYVDQRWLGGTLTNFATIRKRISRLKELEELTEDEAAEADEEGAGARSTRSTAAWPRACPGSRRWTGCPQALFVVDTEQGEDRGRRGEQARTSRSSPSSTPTAIPIWSTTRFRATTTRSARSGCSSSRFADAILEGRDAVGGRRAASRRSKSEKQVGGGEPEHRRPRARPRGAPRARAAEGGAGAPTGGRAATAGPIPRRQARRAPRLARRPAPGCARRLALGRRGQSRTWQGARWRSTRRW